MGLSLEFNEGWINYRRLRLSYFTSRLLLASFSPPNDVCNGEIGHCNEYDKIICSKVNFAILVGHGGTNLHQPLSKFSSIIPH